VENDKITQALWLIVEAQKKLRYTQENWNEEALFDCDDKLDEAIECLTPTNQVPA
jgi:hypothetical protein